MGAVQTIGANYHTKSGSLSTNNLTTVYTCGDANEEFADVTGISVAASTANADTCTVKRLQATDATDYTIVFRGVVEADFPLQIEGLPIHLTKGDAIKLQATAGASNALHYHITIAKTTRTAGIK
jgi:hypothetical protein